MERFVPEKKDRYTTLDAGRVYFFVIVAILALNLIFSFIAEGVASNSILEKEEALQQVYNSNWFNALFSVCSLLVLTLVFFFHKKIENYSYSASKINKKIKWHTILICICVGIVALLGLQYITGVFDDFLTLIKFPVDNSSVFDFSNVGNYLLAIVALALVPAIGEELIFRGVILQGLNGKFSKWGAIALSSAMFALFHMSLQQVFYQFLLGMIMGWIVLATGSLVSSMIVHFTSNFLVITMEFIRVQTGVSLGLAHTWWFYILAIILAGATFAILFIVDKFYFKKRKKTQKDLNDEESVNSSLKSEKVPGFLYLSIAVCLLFLIVSTISSYLEV